MVIPQLDLPIQLQQKGKKDLSPNVMAELDSAIEKLQQIKGEDEVYAWYHIAKIYTYQNQFDKAIGYFEKVYQRDKLWTDFNNIIIALENSEKYSSAMERLLQYLNTSLNDELLEYLLSFLFKYPIESYVTQTKDILEQLKDEKYKVYHQQFDELFQHIQMLDTIQLSVDDYSLINNIHVNIITLFYFGHQNISTYCQTIDGDGLFQKIHIFEADAEDILELNQLYEQKIEQMIEQGQLTIEKYIDIISKYNFSFVIHTETHEEWENSRASS